MKRGQKLLMPNHSVDFEVTLQNMGDNQFPHTKVLLIFRLREQPVRFLWVLAGYAAPAGANNQLRFGAERNTLSAIFRVAGLGIFEKQYIRISVVKLQIHKKGTSVIRETLRPYTGFWAQQHVQMQHQPPPLLLTVLWGFKCRNWPSTGLQPPAASTGQGDWHRQSSSLPYI